MARLGLEDHIVDQDVYDRTVARFQEKGIRLPTFAELADPSKIPAEIKAALADIDPDAPHPLNLFRVHWFNDADRKTVRDVPEYLVLPTELTGVKAKIVLALGQNFPLINAHKVLAAYACLVPRLVTGQFDPEAHRAVWPSTGNYCRGGLAISRILDSHGVAVLPERMSKERFDWLEAWALSPDDIIRTYGCESNVKEIYDECARLDATPENVIFNQFCEFGNHLGHLLCTGTALGTIFDDFAKGTDLRMFGYISATGSAGTLAAGDYLKETYGAKIVAVEALECPTLMYNGFGDHNIQGIGDKHLPLVHNAMMTDAVAAISEKDTDRLAVLFNTEVGRKYLVERKGVDKAIVDRLGALGLSSICNVLAAIKMAKHFDLGEDDVLMTVATDGAAMYGSEIEMATDKYFGGTFDVVNAGETFGVALEGQSVAHFSELTEIDKRRIFNLGYFTWVEQQGVEIHEFEARRHQSFWKDLRKLIPAWDAMIEQFNAKAEVPLP